MTDLVRRDEMTEEEIIWEDWKWLKAAYEAAENEVTTLKARIEELEAAAGKMIEVRDVGAKGRGVFAFRPIAAGTVIETAPVKPFDFTQELPTKLAELPIAWTDYEDAIALGLTQLVNHSDNPNCELVNNLADLTVSLVAIKDIQIGEELSYVYDCELWFEVLP